MPTEFSIKINTTLPTYVTPLVGREQEMKELTQLLLRTDVRILTLIGIGGIGKTRLGLEVSSARAGEELLLVDLPCTLHGVWITHLVTQRQSGHRSSQEEL